MTAARIIVTMALTFCASFVAGVAVILSVVATWFAYHSTEKRLDSEASDFNSAVPDKTETAPIPPSSPAIPDKGDPGKRPEPYPDRPRRIIQW
jgi:hypothetical protein